MQPSPTLAESSSASVPPTDYAAPLGAPRPYADYKTIRRNGSVVPFEDRKSVV